MVKQNSTLMRNALIAVTGLIMLLPGAQAEVIARVDRPAVDLNESFVLEIVVDTNIDMEPDLSVLDENFYRGQLSQLSNTTILNGQIRRSRTWSIALMAKATGGAAVVQSTTQYVRITGDDGVTATATSGPARLAATSGRATL